MTPLLLGLAGCLALAGLALNVVGALGTPVVFVGALLAAWAFDFSVITPWSLVAYALLTVIAEAVEIAGGLLGAKYGGASKFAFRTALAGMLLGALVMLVTFNPLWVFLGLVLGGLLGEYREQRAWRPALKAAAGIALGKLGGILLKSAIALMIIFFCLFQIAYYFYRH